jgi:hypothetical protein
MNCFVRFVKVSRSIPAHAVVGFGSIVVSWKNSSSVRPSITVCVIARTTATNTLVTKATKVTKGIKASRVTKGTLVDIPLRHAKKKGFGVGYSTIKPLLVRMVVRSWFVTPTTSQTMSTSHANP